MMNTIHDTVRLFLIAAALTVGFLLVGCDHKEKIVDVNTPDGGVEVEKSAETGDVTVTIGE